MSGENTYYQQGSMILGTITRIVSYGAFLEFPNGQKGLLHISEISTKFVTDVSSFFAVGDQITVKVIDIDPTNGYLRLSLKDVVQEHPNMAAAPKKKRFPIPDNEIDFAPLEAHLPQWIEQALKEEDKHD